MNIAICDDNQKCINELQGHIRDYFFVKEHNAKKYEIHAFRSGEEFLKSFAPQKYDIIFLDIDMPGISGMEMAEHICKTDRRAQIIFATYMEDQMAYGYRVKAAGFVVKPYKPERIASVINDALAWITVGGSHQIEVRIKGSTDTTRIETRDIMYIESVDHYLKAVKENGVCVEFRGKIAELQSELTEHDFARLHRSYLVNLSYVFIRNANSVRLISGQELPIGRSCARHFRQLYETYRRENG